VVAVDELSLEVAPGELLALVGPSGCGKTTILRLIAGLEAPDQGRIAIRGRLAAGKDVWLPPEARKVSLVFQDYALFPHMTVAENVGFGLRGWEREARVRRVEEVLDMVQLSHLADRYPHELSGGEQQRVALARALAPQPEVLLLDEPFSNLDAGLRAQVREEVRDILKAVGTTVLFVTHDQEEALFMGDRVAVLNAGRLEQVGTPEEVFHCPATRFVAEFMGHTGFLPARVTPEGLETELGFLPQRLPLPPGTEVDVLVRPDDLTLRPDPQGTARVQRRIFQGMHHLHRVVLPSGRIVHCLTLHTEHYPPGSAVRVELAPGHALACFVNGRAIT
jgi:iron(III) transport system ATP-binding protein